MSKKKQKKKVVPPSITDGELAARIRRSLEEGRDKQALDNAKLLAKQQPGEESSDLLRRAYVARVEGLRGKGMLKEADALLAVAQTRFPGIAGEMGNGHLIHAVRNGSVDGLLKELISPGISSSHRRTLEKILFEELRDPRLLRDSPVLPADHPLKLAASQIFSALEGATTEGRVGEEVVLDRVSPRGALAAWKPFVLMVAAFEQGDDEAARHFLGQIPPDSACARIAPTMKCLLDGKPLPPDSPKGAHALVHHLGEQTAENLRTTLRQMVSIPIARFAADNVEAAEMRLVTLCRQALRLTADSPPAFRQHLAKVLWVRLFAWGLAQATRVIPEARNWGADEPIVLLGIRSILNELGANGLVSAWFAYRALLALETVGAIPSGSPAAVPLLKLIDDDLASRSDADGSIFEELAELRLDLADGTREILLRAMPPAIAREYRLFLDGTDIPPRLHPGNAMIELCVRDPNSEAFEAAIAGAVGRKWKKTVRTLLAEWARYCPDNPAPVEIAFSECLRAGQLRDARLIYEQLEKIEPDKTRLHCHSVRLSFLRMQKNFPRRKEEVIDQEARSIALLADSLPEGRAFLAAVEWYAGEYLGRERQKEDSWRALKQVFGSAEKARGFLAMVLAGLPFPRTKKIRKEIALQKITNLRARGQGFAAAVAVLTRMELSFGFESFDRDLVDFYARQGIRPKDPPGPYAELLLTLALVEKGLATISLSLGVFRTMRDPKPLCVALIMLIYYSYFDNWALETLFEPFALCKKLVQEIDSPPLTDIARLQEAISVIEDEDESGVIARLSETKSTRALLGMVRRSHWFHALCAEIWGAEAPTSSTPDDDGEPADDDAAADPHHDVAQLPDGSQEAEPAVGEQVEIWAYFDDDLFEE